MLNISRDIDSLSNFKRNSAALIDQLRETAEPMVLTVNGRPAVVVQSPEGYQRLLELAERAEAIEGIRRGLESLDRAEGIPAEEAFDQLRRKHDIPREA
jgi:prevent-host-death family protein